MKKKKILILILLFSSVLFGLCYYMYRKDRNQYEPKLWIGFFDYRLNFRDVGKSLNECLNKSVFKTGKIFRSDRYFSGWSCDKINNPDKIYSLNFSPWDPHAYYCKQKNGERLFGSHPNTTFEITEIENLTQWKKPEFKSTMCSFVKDNLNDLIQHKSFLFHCDIGRDRTGAYAALLSMMLIEQRFYNVEKMQNAIECDYEKTQSLPKNEYGKMKNFLEYMDDHGGVGSFIQKQCNITDETLELASDEFYK